MGKKEQNTDFVCVVCRQRVTALRNGGYRNHCPFCLSSLHLDDRVPGDRKSHCHGIMKACKVQFSGNKGWQIVHKCLTCGAERVNKIAERDVQSDDWTMIVILSREIV